MSHDLNGRPYLKLSEAKAGQMIETDGGFTCIGECQHVELLTRKDGTLYFICEEGQHRIDGSADDGEHCMGLYPELV